MFDVIVRIVSQKIFSVIDIINLYFILSILTKIKYNFKYTFSFQLQDKTVFAWKERKIVQQQFLEH